MLMILHFCTGKTMVASSTGTSKGSAGKDVQLIKPPLVGEHSPGVEVTLVRRTGVLDIALTSGSGGAVTLFAACYLNA
jgi:hypothetical protein